MDAMRRFSRRAWWLHLLLMLAVIVPPQTASAYWTLNAQTGTVEWAEPPEDLQDPWWDVDSDGDGLNNRDELAFFSDPYSIDADADGLTDLDERDVSQTDSWNWDSDGNGFSDYDDYYHGLNQLLHRVDYRPLIQDNITFYNFKDADGDGNPNPWDEDPLNFDIDGDGLVNWQDAYPEDPQNGEGAGYWYNGVRYPGEWVDTDSDAIPDPADPFPEGSIWWEGVEYDISYAADADGDGIPNAWDNDPPQEDPSLYNPGTNYPPMDSDHDGIPDATDLFPQGSVWWYGREYELYTPDPGLISTAEWNEMVSLRYTYDHRLGQWVAPPTPPPPPPPPPPPLDTDGDGVPDELDSYPDDPWNGADSDLDGLTNQAEITEHFTDPWNIDTDGDGLTDHEELYVFHTNPLAVKTNPDQLHEDFYMVGLDRDADTDGLPDHVEDWYQRQGHGLNKNDPNDAGGDLDGDGISNLEAWYQGWNLTANLVRYDTDGDGITDAVEDWWNLQYPGIFNKLYFDDSVQDYDEDGVLNVEEIRLELNPGDATTDGLNSDLQQARWRTSRVWNMPILPGDVDGDGMSDLWEHRHNFDLRNPTDAALDADMDFLPNLLEFQTWRNPWVQDYNAPGSLPGDLLAEEDEQDSIAPSANTPWSAQLPGSINNGTTRSFNLADGGVETDAPGMIPRVQTKKYTHTMGQSFPGHHEAGTWLNRSDDRPSVEAESDPIESCVAQDHLAEEGYCPCQHGTVRRFYKREYSETYWVYQDGTRESDMNPDDPRLLALAQPDHPGWHAESEGGWTWELHEHCQYAYTPMVSGSAYMRIKIHSTLQEGNDPISRQATVKITFPAQGTIPERTEEHVATMTIMPGSRVSNAAGDVAPAGGSIKVTLIPDDSSPKAPPVSLADAAGTRYRKIGLNGFPVPDAKPQVQSENGENPEETHLDPFSSQLRHSVSDVYVEAPGSLLPLTVRRDLTPDAWNDRSGLRGEERPWQPFGPGWTSNVCAYVKFTNLRQAEVVDEQGSSHTYFLIGGDPFTAVGGTWMHDRQEHRDVKTRMNAFTAKPEVKTDADGTSFSQSLPEYTQITLVKKFGTKCTYQMLPPNFMHQAIASDRVMMAKEASIHTYARLAKVTDRHGNQLVYEYPDFQTLIPKRIHDPDRPGHEIRITQQMGRIITVQDPSGHQIHYAYTHSSAPNHPAITLEPSVSVLQGGVFQDSVARLHHTTLLTSVRQGDASVGYHYRLMPDCEPPDEEDDPGTVHLHVALSQIVDERGHAWSFGHAFNRANYSWTGSALKLQHGVPLLLTQVQLPDGTTTHLQTNRTINPADGIYPTTVFTTTVTTQGPGSAELGIGAEMRRGFQYTFSDPALLTPTGQYEATASPTCVTYAYRQMDITAIAYTGQTAEPAGTESFYFEPDASMALRKTVDRSGAVTEFVYDAGGYDDPVKERRQVAANSWLEKSFEYDAETRILTETMDARGIATQHTLIQRTFTPPGRPSVTAKGLRSSETVQAPPGIPGGSKTTWEYTHPQFAAFTTRQTVDFVTARDGTTTPSALDVPAVVTTYATAASGSTPGWWRRITETRQMGGQTSSTLTVSDFNGRKRSVTDPRGQTTLFDYDARGRLTQVTHPDGTKRSLSYDAHGNLTREQDEEGVYTFHAYDSLNRRISTTLDLNRNGIADARYTQVTHDANGVPSHDGDIVTEVLHYNSLNLPVLERDARGILTTHEYDFLGRKTRTTVNPTGSANERSVTSWDYLVSTINDGKEAGGSVFDTSSHKPVRITDPLGRQTIFTYNTLHQLVRERRPDGNVIHRTYNPNGQPASVTSAAPNAWSPSFVTVESHQQINHATAAGAGVFVTSTLYDALGLPHQVTLPDGLTTFSFHTPYGKPWRQVDDTGAETLTYYDSAGLPVRVAQDLVPVAAVSPQSPGVITTLDARPVTMTEYDLAGNAVKITDPLGKVTRTRYDARNRPWKVIQPAVVHPDYADAPENTPGKYVLPVTLTAYDAVGRVIRVTNPLGHLNRSVYDAAGRLVRVFDPLDNATSHTHDPAGNILTSTDPLGRVTRNVYDGLGRLKQTTDPSGIITVFAYDAAGNRTGLTDGLGRTTSFLYDSLNRLTRQTHPNGDAVIHTWQLDRKVSETDPAGRVTSFTYDARGRLTLQKATTSGLGTGAMESQRLYDAAGRLAKAVDLTQGHSLTTPGVAGRYLYDKLGRLTSETSYATNADGTGLTHFHHYDRSGNRVRSELACGMGVAKRLLTTTLDSQHRPVILHDDNQTPGVTTDDRLTRWLYDPAGRTVRVTLPNGQIQVNHHDAAGRLVLRALHRKPASGQTISNATLLASFTWNHDAAGNVKSQTENWYASGSQPARSRATAMAYDASNRLVEERIHDSGGTDPVVTTYTYDAANNRTGKIVALGSGSAPSGVETGHWSYTYNTANQLTRWVKRAAPGTGTVLAAASYSYDKNGNRLSKVVDGTTSLAVRTTTYTWDSWNRLAEVTVPVTATSKKSYEYTYDYRMRRKSLRQSGGGLKTHHTAVVFNGGLSVAEFRRSSNAALSPTDLPWARYLRGPDMGGGVGGLLGTLRHPVNSSEVPVSPTASSPVTERVNLSNGRGDIVAQSDVAGTLTWTASYEAYGKRTLELGSNEDRQRANTKEEDPTGLLNEGYRYRDIETGVWLSRDPAGFVDGPNLYAYVKQNPWTGFDPDGLFVIALPAIPVLVESAVVTAGVIALAWKTLTIGDKTVPSNHNKTPSDSGRPKELVTTPVAKPESQPGVVPADPKPTSLPGADSSPISKPTSTPGIDANPAAKPTSTPGQQTAKETRDQNILLNSQDGSEDKHIPGSYRPSEPLPRDENGIPAADPKATGPHTQIGTQVGRNGPYTQAREFDFDGNPVKDIDFTDHGRPNGHSNPHQHRYLQNKTGGTPMRGGQEPLQ